MRPGRAKKSAVHQRQAEPWLQLLRLAPELETAVSNAMAVRWRGPVPCVDCSVAGAQRVYLIHQAIHALQQGLVGRGGGEVDPGGLEYGVWRL